MKLDNFTSDFTDTCLLKLVSRYNNTYLVDVFRFRNPPPQGRSRVQCHVNFIASRVPNQVLPIISSPTQVTAKKTQLQNPFSTPKSQQKGILSVLLRA